MTASPDLTDGPLDRHVDRRAFLSRVAILAAVPVAGTVALPRAAAAHRFLAPPPTDDADAYLVPRPAAVADVTELTIAEAASLIRATAAARSAFLATMADIPGCTVVDVSLPDDWNLLTGGVFNNVRLAERSEPFMPQLRSDLRGFGVSLTSWLQGVMLGGDEYITGQRAKLLLLERVLDDLFRQCDVMVQTDPCLSTSSAFPSLRCRSGQQRGSDGTPTVVGVWRAERTITPDAPRFADAGFALSGTYQWRVRARFGTTPQPYSEPIVDTTLPQWGTGPGASLRTQWESSGNATYTSDVNEYAYEAALVATSPRVRMVELGRTNPVATGPAAPGNRPVNMLIIGGTPDLTPLSTAQQISDSPAIAYNCNVHGNEPQGRESCLIFARMLAFTEDPHLLDILRQTTVLIVPTINGNGRAANTRGNETGQDLNRDYALITQPETKAFVAMLRDYTPEVGIDLHEGDSEDLPILSARHLNVYEPMFQEGKTGLVEGWMYQHGAESGWWHGPYSTGGDSHEGILRNTFSLKNTVGMLAENRASGGATRPAEGTQLANRNRKSYGSLYEEFTTLEYYWTRRAQIHGLVEQSIAFNTSNTGPAVTRGSYPWPYNPLNGTNTGLPDTDALTPDHDLNPAPCGYFLSEEQYSGERSGGSVQLRLNVHGIAQQSRPVGHVVRLAQPQRGLIPTLFDEAAVAPEPILVATRLADRRTTVIVGGRDSGVPNRVLPGGCSINDLILDEVAWPDHDTFMDDVQSVLDEFQTAGLVSGRERGAITTAAAQSSVGH